MSDNPLQSDKKLQKLLANVGSIQSGEAFLSWKASFLKVYKSYLDPDGVLNARDADGRLVKKLQNLAKVSLKVQSLAEQGHISKVQVTADGRRALGKWTEEMATVEREVAKFCPKTTKDIDTVGYDKFELGAVLIQDGFQAYEIMLTNRDFIDELRDGPLEGLLDRNQVSIADFYSREMESFVQIMSDLGLMKLMTKCVEVYQDESRPDPAKEVDILTEPDTDEVHIDKRLGKGPDTAGKSSKGEKTKTPGKAGSRRRSPTSSNNRMGDDDDDLPPPPADQDNEEPPPQEGEGGGGEKIIYFDPKSGNIGLILKEKCMTSELMFQKDDKGEPQLNGVIETKDEKENLVWLLKKLEKKKPKEGAWLEDIKKEKAARLAKEGGKAKRPSVRVKKEPAPGASPAKPNAKRPVRKLSSAKEVSSSGNKGPGLKNPSEHGSAGSPTGKGKKKLVQDYDGIYKSAAPKPANSGWQSVAPADK